MSKLFGNELKPSQAIFKDINVTDDAYNFVYASGRFDGFNETQQLALYDYYIERHTYWEKNYYE